MAEKTYHGSCHCGRIRFEAEIDLAAGTHRCNCSHCTKTRGWFTFVRPEKFRSEQDVPGAQAQYQWVPPGRDGSVLHHQFCPTCGVRVFGWGDHESMGGKWYYVYIATLDDVDADELAAAPIRYVDGRHDRFQDPPSDTRLL